MASVSLAELRERLEEAYKELEAANDDVTQAASKITTTETGTSGWRQAMSEITRASSEVVKLQGGEAGDGKTIKGEITVLQEQIASAEFEAAFAEASKALAEIEVALKEAIVLNGLGERLAAFEYARIDFQVSFDSAGEPMVSVVRHGGQTGRSRTIGVVGTTSKAPGPGALKGEWNGEYYVSFGEWEGRNWEEARQYGFISGGGGAWYSKTLQLLSPGDRIWVNVPKRGFVGVGRVSGHAVIAKNFRVMIDGEPRKFLDVARAHYFREFADNEEKAEYIVAVDWIDTKPVQEAVSEVGFFGNQNTVCRPVTPKWDHTVERLKRQFRVDEPIHSVRLVDSAVRTEEHALPESEDGFHTH